MGRKKGMVSKDRNIHSHGVSHAVLKCMGTPHGGMKDTLSFLPQPWSTHRTKSVIFGHFRSKSDKIRHPVPQESVKIGHFQSFSVKIGHPKEVFPPHTPSPASIPPAHPYTQNPLQEKNSRISISRMRIHNPSLPSLISGAQQIKKTESVPREETLNEIPT